MAKTHVDRPGRYQHLDGSRVTVKTPSRLTADDHFVDAGSDAAGVPASSTATRLLSKAYPKREAGLVIRVNRTVVADLDGMVAPTSKRNGPSVHRNHAFMVKRQSKQQRDWALCYMG